MLIFNNIPYLSILGAQRYCFFTTSKLIYTIFIRFPLT